MKTSIAAGLLLSALALGAGYRLPAAETAPQVVVHTDQADGKVVADSITNATYAALYGQTTSSLGDMAFQWVRATNGLSYVRCYNWLGDGIPEGRSDWFSGCRVAKAGPNGDLVYQWEGLERVLDVLMASGVKPVIVCGGIPDVLAEGPIRRNEGGAAVNRPRDYARYQDMITQMLRRLVKTYGPEEVRTWYFEVWSQPDHEGSWAGGRPAPFTERVTAEQLEPFNKLYDHFAAGALAVDDKLKIGGPGLAGDLSFLRLFLDHCVKGTNAVTGKPGTRLDFVSWHRYGTVADILRWNSEVRGVVETGFPQLKGLQFLLTESGSGAVEGARANTAYEAARLAALLDANSKSQQGVDLIFRSGDLVDDHFNGSRALITRIGETTIPLPAFRFNMLASKLGNERLKADAPAGVGVLATHPATKTGRNTAQALIYRYDPSILPGTGEAMTVKVRIAGLPSNLLQLPLRIYQLDETTCSPYETWQAAGSPRPSREVDQKKQVDVKLVELGRTLADKNPFLPTEENKTAFVNSGEVSVDVKMLPNSVTLVTLGAEPAYDIELSKRGNRLRTAEDEAGQVAELVRNRQYPKAVDGLKKLQEKYADTYWRELALYGQVDLYEQELRSPEQAEAARRELLKLPIDDFFRLRLLERLRVDLARRQDTAGVGAITNEIAELERKLAAQRQVSVRRYTGQ